MVLYRVMVRDGVVNTPRPITRWLRTLWYARKILRDYDMRHCPEDVWIESCSQLEFDLD